MTVLRVPRRFESIVQLYLDRLRKDGYGWLLGRVLKRVAAWTAWLLLLPATILLHLAGLRRVTVFTDRIGHLAGELDCFVKQQRLGRLPSRRWFVLAPERRVANRCLLDYWARHVTIITSPLLCGLLGIMSRRWLLVYDISRYMLRPARCEYYATFAEWGERPPILELTEADRAAGRAMLESMGVPKGAWFACVHAREAGFSPVDEVLHAHRNGDVGCLIPAIEFITSRGGWCVRMGDPSMKALPPMRSVVDYAHHPARSPRMDVFLCASCRLFVGNSSGLFIVASCFGVPSALANMIPASAFGYSPRDLSIVKLLRRRGAADYIGFAEAFGPVVSDYRIASQFESAAIELEENSAQDILELVQEALGVLEGRGGLDEADAARARALHALLFADHYACAAGSRLGAAFLRKYQRLLDRK